MSGPAELDLWAGCSWAPSEAVVGCSAVSRTFTRSGRQTVALRPCTLVVPAGSRVALTGPSGSGKSTLLHILAGLDTPTSGLVRWPGLSGPPRGRPGTVAMVFQGPSLVPALDVAENVALPLVLAGRPDAEARARTAAALDRLDLAGLSGSLPGELSAGQAQRIAVARVLASRPRLILADEPTGRLDRDTAEQVVAVLLAAAQELGAALVVATHDQLVARRFPTRWRMADGELSSAPEPVGPGEEPNRS